MTWNPRVVMMVLAALLPAWLAGAAHAQLGACCFNDEGAATCTETNAAICDETGGIYLGVGTTCATSECHVAEWMLVLDHKTDSIDLPMFDTQQQSRVLQSVAGRVDATSMHTVSLTVSPDRMSCVTVEGSRVDVRVFIDASSDDVPLWPMLSPLTIDSGFPWAPGPDDPLFCGGPGADPMDPAICPEDLGGPESCDYGSPFGYIGSDGFLIEDSQVVQPFAVDGQQMFVLNVDGQSVFIPYASLTVFSNPMSQASGTVVLGYGYDLLEGGCCLPDGNCTVTTRPQCTSMQGLYAGDGTTCSQTNQCRGACCFEDGCEVLPEPACINQGGTFIAIGTDCEAPTQCPAPCCLEGGGCTIQPQDQCQQGCGVYGEIGEPCTFLCQKVTFGACCLPDGTCEPLCPVDCQNLGGVYQGQTIECDAVTCPQPTGCPGDLDNDDTIGVFDLLDLLSQWGSCGEPCPPSCAADIAGDFDCAVNVFDLLDLLSAWGPCD